MYFNVAEFVETFYPETFYPIDIYPVIMDNNLAYRYLNIDSLLNLLVGWLLSYHGLWGPLIN